MNFKMADLTISSCLSFFFSVSLSRWQGGASLLRFCVSSSERSSTSVTLLCRLGQMFQVLANSSICYFFLGSLCGTCYCQGFYILPGQEKAFVGGELSSTFILLLHFLGSCDVNASCFPTSKSLGSREFSAAIIWLVFYTCFLLFSC